MEFRPIDRSVQLMIMTICFLLFLSCMMPSGISSNYSITIKDTLYEATKTKDVGSETIQYYDIHIILTNSGTETSDNITVELLEEGIPITKSYAIQASESKTYTFNDVPSPTKEITINYYPTDDSIDSTNTNSGSKIIQLGTGTGSTQSSHFIEGIFIIISILSLAIFYKNNRKKR